jgi:hypothetical protein
MRDSISANRSLVSQKMSPGICDSCEITSITCSRRTSGASGLAISTLTDAVSSQPITLSGKW